MNNKTEQDNPQKIYQKKWFIPAVLGCGTLILGGIYISGMNGNSEAEAPSSSPSISIAAPEMVSPNSSEGASATIETATPEPATPQTQDTTAQTEVEKAAQNFLKSIKDGNKNGQEWANQMKNMVSSSLYESMKHSGSAVIPEGGEKVNVEAGKSETEWNANVLNSKDEVIWSFSLKGINIGENDRVLLVTQIDGLPTNEGQKDDKGHAVATAPQPLNSSQVEAMKLDAYYVAKSYLEYQKGDTVEERKATLSARLPGGFPDLRPTPEGLGYDIQAYAPAGYSFSEERLGEKTPNGMIGLNLYVTYADAAFEPVKDIEEVGLRVNFRFDESTGLWTADSLELLSNRPFMG